MDSDYSELFKKQMDIAGIKNPENLIKLTPKDEFEQACIDSHANRERIDTPLFVMTQPDYLKYYTPSLEDIRVGYECEWLQDPSKDFWIPLEVTLDRYKFIVQNGQEGINFGIRTPFLTKEQIQAEEWKIGDHSMIFMDFEGTDDAKIINMIKKDGITLVIDIDDREILLGEIKLSVPSINEFRYITKNLLKAK